VNKNRKVGRISAKAAFIISCGVIAIGVVLMVTNLALTVAFNVGIALLVVGAAIIVLAKNQPYKLASERFSSSK